MKPLQDRPRRRFGRLPWPFLCMALAVIATSASQLRARRAYEVAKPTENIRSAPEGLRLGVLEKGTQIEEIARDGNWVKFELVAWIWGPSLEGFEDGSSSGPSRQDDATTVPGRLAAGDDGAKSPPGGGARKPRQALAVHLEEIRALVNGSFGRFYGLSLNRDLQQVILRFRVPDVGEEVLMRRQMRAQAQVDSILAPDVDFTRLRIETNRPDGTGTVGQFVAVADTATIRRIAGADLEAWLAAVRRSDDGGHTWK